MRKYYELNQPLQHIPNELAEIFLTCSLCNSIFKPDWLEKLNEPLIPLIPKDSSLTGRWRPASVPVKCPYCTGYTQFAIPQKKLNSNYFLYGDEAYRETREQIIFCYSIVGTNKNFIPLIEKRIYDFKRTIFPDKNPLEWKLHMMDIWSSDRRKRSIFKDFTFEKVNEIVAAYFELIRNLGNGFVIYCFSSVAKRPVRLGKSFLLGKKVEIYSLLILRIIQAFTDQQIKPFFTFDSEKIGNTDNIIHEWAEKAFVGSQHSLLYGYLSGATEIEMPTFVKPGSHPCLEIADFISYVVARYCLMQLTNRKIDLPPENLGNINYLGFERGGDLLYIYQDSYPWDLFYKQIE